MIAALDVHYDEAQSLGIGAAVLFERWDADVPAAEVTATISNIQAYIPGEFFRRELPCLLAVINKIQVAIDVFVVDGYVRLNERPGLGQHLFEHLPRQVPVIGVAKTRFHGAAAVEVLRGESKSPLYVTAIGIDPAEAAEHIKNMHGPHRLPSMLKRADRLGRVS